MNKHCHVRLAEGWRWEWSQFLFVFFFQYLQINWGQEMLSILACCSQMFYLNIYMHVCSHTAILHLFWTTFLFFLFYFICLKNGTYHIPAVPCSIYSAPDLVNDVVSPVEMLMTAHTQLKLKGVLFDPENTRTTGTLATGFLQNTCDRDWWSCQAFCVWSENIVRHFLPCSVLV